ncbi:MULTISPECIES: glycosyltransferase family 4 protein [Pseudomonas]|uniref:Glycosyltransferase family 4 protein n=1 Tax=Pseudomonas sp. WC2401 TaxID=3234143 RepID=A0AB39WRU3_9PSED
MILFILYEFVSSTQKGASGGNISNYLLIDKLRQHKKIGIIAPNISKDLVNELEDKGIFVVTDNLELRPPFGGLKKRQWFKTAIDLLIRSHPKLISELDIVVTSNGTCDLTEKLRTNKTQFYILCRAFEDFFDHESHYPLQEKIRRKFKKIYAAKKIALAYRSADRIVTNSEFMKDFIGTYYPKVDISVLYPPIDIPLKNLKPIPSKPRVGIINPSARKGEGVFLSLAHNHPELNFVYFSQNPKKYSSKNIHYAGWCSDRDKLFTHIDILIAPSAWTEPFGRVSVEAVRSGIPVLVSNIGGLPETVDSSFVVTTQTIECWEDKLSWITSNPNEVEEAWSRSVLKSADFEQSSHDKNALNIFATP